MESPVICQDQSHLIRKRKFPYPVHLNDMLYISYSVMSIMCYHERVTHIYKCNDAEASKKKKKIFGCGVICDSKLIA
jgi:hypothetical protein